MENQLTDEQKLRETLHDQNTKIEEAITKLNRAKLVLNYWSNEYGSMRKPNKELMKKIENGYFFMTEFIDIAFDCVYDASESLENTLRLTCKAG